MSRSIKLIAVTVNAVAALLVGAQAGAVSTVAGPGDGWCC